MIFVKKIISIFFILISTVSISFAHPGRTDKYGGHYNNLTGTYHYHDGNYSGEYTAPVEEGEIRIDEAEQEQIEEQTTELKVTDTSEEYVKELEKKNQNLEEQIQAKQNTIENLNNKIDEKNKEIHKLENNKKGMWLVFSFILIIIAYISYKIGLNK